MTIRADTPSASTHPHLHAMRGSHAVLSMLRRPDFRRLYAARLSAQWGDGMFQASLAGTVLFNPQHAATPADLAASFAVMLLPYSVVGPFVGVLLDRFSRRTLLAITLILRAVTGLAAAGLIWIGHQGIGFYVVALLALSMSRFFLAGLSACLPHAVDRRMLVSANAFTATSGTVVTLIGGGCAIGLVKFVAQDNDGYAFVAATSAIGAMIAAIIFCRFSRRQFGPDHAERASSSHVVDVFRGLVDGARVLLRQSEAAGVLLAIAAHRFLFGALTVSILNLFKNHVPAGGLIPNDIGGIGIALGAGGVGALLAATITPAITRDIGKNAWVSLSYGVAGTCGALLMIIDATWVILVAVFLIGFAGQAVKLCGDTIVQERIDESYHGRTFSVYDTSFNACFVVGVVVAAFTVPTAGYALWLYLASAASYLIIAITYRLAAACHESFSGSTG